MSRWPAQGMTVHSGPVMAEYRRASQARRRQASQREEVIATMPKPGKGYPAPMPPPKTGGKKK